jgi:signal transduction histidine kinase
MRLFPRKSGGSGQLGLLLLRRVFGIYLLLALVVTLVHVALEYRHQAQLTRHNLQRAEEILSPVLSKGLWHLDPVLIDSTVAGAMRFPDIVGVSLHDPYEAALGRRGLLAIDQQQQPSVDVNGAVVPVPEDVQFVENLLEHRFSLEENGEFLGEARFYSSPAVVIAKLENSLLLILLSALVKTTALWLLFLFFAHRFLGRPLTRVTNTLRSLHPERLSEHRLPLQGLHGELELLGTAFNRTLDRLHDAQQQQRQNEEELRQLLEELQRSHDDLQQTQQQLIQSTKMATMGEMLAMIAHQWRQPLSVISTVASNMGLQIRLQKQTPETQQQQLEKIQQTTQFLSRTINDFRNFFRPDRTLQVVALQEPLQHAFHLLEENFARQHIHVHWELQTLPEQPVYSNELQQVVLNLLKNAHDVLLEREILEKQLWIRLRLTTEHIPQIEIEDNAGGVPDSIRGRIFEPYFSTKSELNGTGLGLYMSKMIIEDHMQGQLSVENTARGACFCISLPPLAEVASA